MSLDAENHSASTASTASKPDPHRVVYTEVTQRHTRRHGTRDLGTKEQAEVSRRMIEDIEGYEDVHVVRCTKGESFFSEAAQARRGALPHVLLRPFVNEEEDENARFIDAHPDQTLTGGAVWVRVIVEFVAPHAEQPEEGPPNTTCVLAGYATPEQVFSGDFEEKLRPSGQEELRASARDLRRRAARQKGDTPEMRRASEAQRLLLKGASVLEHAFVPDAGPAFRSKVKALAPEAARFQRERGAEPIPPFSPKKVKTTELPF